MVESRARGRAAAHAVDAAARALRQHDVRSGDARRGRFGHGDRHHSGVRALPERDHREPDDELHAGHTGRRRAGRSVGAQARTKPRIRRASFQANQDACAQALATCQFPGSGHNTAGRHPAMITVHHLELALAAHPGCSRLGVAYEIQAYKRDPKTSLAPQAVRVHRSAVTGHYRRRLTLAESGAIVEYLVERHAGTRPARGARLTSCATPTGCTSPRARDAAAGDEVASIGSNTPDAVFARPIARGIAQKVRNDDRSNPRASSSMETELTAAAGSPVTRFPRRHPDKLPGRGGGRARAAGQAQYRALERIHARPAYYRLERGSKLTILSVNRAGRALGISPSAELAMLPRTAVLFAVLLGGRPGQQPAGEDP